MATNQTPTEEKRMEQMFQIATSAMTDLENAIKTVDKSLIPEIPMREVGGWIPQMLVGVTGVERPDTKLNHLDEDGLPYVYYDAFNKSANDTLVPTTRLVTLGIGGEKQIGFGSVRWIKELSMDAFSTKQAVKIWSNEKTRDNAKKHWLLIVWMVNAKLQTIPLKDEFTGKGKTTSDDERPKKRSKGSKAKAKAKQTGSKRNKQGQTPKSAEMIRNDDESSGEELTNNRSIRNRAMATGNDSPVYRRSRPEKKDPTKSAEFELVYQKRFQKYRYGKLGNYLTQTDLDSLKLAAQDAGHQLPPDHVLRLAYTELMQKDSKHIEIDFTPAWRKYKMEQEDPDGAEVLRQQAERQKNERMPKTMDKALKVIKHKQRLNLEEEEHKACLREAYRIVRSERGICEFKTLEQIEREWKDRGI